MNSIRSHAMRGGANSVPTKRLGSWARGAALELSECLDATALLYVVGSFVVSIRTCMQELNSSSFHRVPVPTYARDSTASFSVASTIQRTVLNSGLAARYTQFLPAC